MNLDRLQEAAWTGIRTFNQNGIGAGFHRRGITADQVTLAGMMVTLAGCVAWCFQVRWPWMFWVGVVVALLGATSDMIDGAVARASGRPTEWGKNLDSFTDRVVEGAMFTSLVYVLAHQGKLIAAAGAVMALSGSFLVTYVRGRAEQNDCKGDYGPGDRAVRLIVLGCLVLAGKWIGYEWAIWAINALAWFTAIRRAVKFRQELIAKGTP
jgi:CDP-diacylglycerol--glycerol-3-phosphate 3-phosphatidyltransferase